MDKLGWWRAHPRHWGGGCMSCLCCVFFRGCFTESKLSSLGNYQDVRNKSSQRGDLIGQDLWVSKRIVCDSMVNYCPQRRFPQKNRNCKAGLLTIQWNQESTVMDINTPTTVHGSTFWVQLPIVRRGILDHLMSEDSVNESSLHTNIHFDFAFDKSIWISCWVLHLFLFSCYSNAMQILCLATVWPSLPPNGLSEGGSAALPAHTQAHSQLPAVLPKECAASYHQWPPPSVCFLF